MYDTIIIGCGPAGMTAALYLARANKKVLILEKEAIGGEIASSPMVENYPGYLGISGSELTAHMFDQIEALGVDFQTVLRIKDGPLKEVITDTHTYETKTIILATGARYRLLGLPNETNLIGNGIHFCVACDGAFYKNKIVAVIGGGNSAITNALALADVCKKVYLIQNLDHLTGEATLQTKITSMTNVTVMTNAVVTKINATNELTSIIINHKDELTIDGMFIAIGLVPQTEAFRDVITTDQNGYFISNDCQTNIPGIYVAGDARTKNFRQLTTATNDGTIAALEAINYLTK